MEAVLKHYPASLIEKARKIKAIVCDVDGVLTDGGIIYDNQRNEFKKFNVKDGQIISHLKKAGLLVGAITGRESEVVKFRCRELNFDFHHHGAKDKLAIYREVKEKYGLVDEEIAYLGDDIIDIPILAVSGLGIVPSDAVSYIFEYANMVTKAKGGEGVLREAADFILASQNKLKDVIQFYIAQENKI